MELFLLVVAVLSAVASSEATCTSSCLIDLPFGKIQGKCNDGVCSFTNVPYALSPTGDRRFEAPVTYNEVWPNVRDATKDIVWCIQFNQRGPTAGAAEDCLFVNIYVPSSGDKASYPVRAYIHGGGFMFGSPGEYDPSRSPIVKSGMILVTIGYRLGPLGFLSTGDKCIPGNNGLKDQREALRWIKKYISYFNGNPKRVLLSGWSAGGASSHLHLLRKENLFSAVMANNGVAFNPWVFQPKPYVQYSKFTSYINCSNSCAMVKDCIKGKSVESILSATQDMKPFGNNPFNVFGIVVENADVRDAFLTERPEAIIQSGRASEVPFLIAYTEREGSYTAAEWMGYDDNGKPLIAQLNNKWLEYAPKMLFYNNTLPAAFLDQRSLELKKQYLGDKAFNQKNYRLMEDMFSDVLYVNGIKKAICLHRKYSAGKLFVYEYKYPHTYGVGNLMSHRRDVAFGADHGADGIFTIPIAKLEPTTLTANEQSITKRLCELYKTLANGRPFYDDIELPSNTPLKSAKLTINEFCHEVNYCSDGSNCGDCSEFE